MSPKHSTISNYLYSVTGRVTDAEKAFSEALTIYRDLTFQKSDICQHDRFTH